MKLKIPNLKNLRPNIPKWIANRYVLITVWVVVWLLFMDKYDLRTRAKMGERIGKLETDKAFYQKEISRLRMERNLLRSDRAEVERIAREAYLMKRDNEDIFVVVEGK